MYVQILRTKNQVLFLFFLFSSLVIVVVFNSPSFCCLLRLSTLGTTLSTFLSLEGGFVLYPRPNTGFVLLV